MIDSQPVLFQRAKDEGCLEFLVVTTEEGPLIPLYSVRASYQSPKLLESDLRS